MSKEFVTKVGDTGSSFRISFSEEQPEPKVSKLTLSSDFTHSYEESYEGDDDVLVVDIDYGDGNANEGANGNEDKDENDVDSPNSISRSSSLSNSYKREKPKFGLRRFKSVEEIIDVSPAKPKKKLQKTISDYEARYKGLEKKEARLTLSADFAHSYEENFEDDGEILIVDIDYSKGETSDNDIFSASDNFGRSGSENEIKLRKYHSHEDIRSSSYTHRELERPSSGYEIAFINENRPDEMKKLSLSADLLITGEEAMHPTAELETRQTVTTNRENGTDDDLFDMGKLYVTSTPHKNTKNIDLQAFRKDDGVTKGLKYEKAFLLEDAPEIASAIVDEPMPLNTEEPSEAYSAAPKNGNKAEFHEDSGDDCGGTEGEKGRKEDEKWKMNSEKDSIPDLDSISQKHDIEGSGFRAPVTSMGEQNVNKVRVVSKYSLEIRGAKPKESSEWMNVGHTEDEVVPQSVHDVMNAEGADLEGGEEASLERSTDDLKIDLDDILIIDIDSNDQESVNIIEGESNASDGSIRRRDNYIEIEKGGTPKRAELYIYSLNQTTEVQNATVNDDNEEFPCIDNNISQKEKLISLKGTDDPVKSKQSNSLDKMIIATLENDSASNKEKSDSTEENDALVGKRHSIEEEANISLYKADPSFGAKMRLLDLADNDGNETSEPLEDKDAHGNDIDYLKNKEELFIDEEDVRSEKTSIKNTSRAPAVERDRSDSVEKNSRMEETDDDVAEAESENENLESGLEDGSCKGVVESCRDPGEDNVGDVDGEVEKLSDGVLNGDHEERNTRECEDNVEQLENFKTKKFFTMIISPEVQDCHSNVDSDEEEKGSTSLDSVAKKYEYLFPMPVEMKLMNKSDDDKTSKEWNGNEAGQVSPEENETEREADSAKNWKIWKRFWPNLWWFKDIQGESTKSSKTGKLTDLGGGPIPNGSCKMEDDHDAPKLITKVYRLRDIHHGRRRLTETIRVFFQQEDVLSFILEPGQ